MIAMLEEAEAIQGRTGTGNVHGATSNGAGVRGRRSHSSSSEPLDCEHAFDVPTRQADARLAHERTARARFLRAHGAPVCHAYSAVWHGTVVVVTRRRKDVFGALLDAVEVARVQRRASNDQAARLEQERDEGARVDGPAGRRLHLWRLGAVVRVLIVVEHGVRAERDRGDDGMVCRSVLVWLTGCQTDVSLCTSETCHDPLAGKILLRHVSHSRKSRFTRDEPR